MEKNPVIDLSKLPSGIQRNICKQLKIVLINEATTISDDLEYYNDGSAKTEMLAWREELYKLQKQANKFT